MASTDNTMTDTFFESHTSNQHTKSRSRSKSQGRIELEASAKDLVFEIDELLSSQHQSTRMKPLSSNGSRKRNTNRYKKDLDHVSKNKTEKHSNSELRQDGKRNHKKPASREEEHEITLRIEDLMSSDSLILSQTTLNRHSFSGITSHNHIPSAWVTQRDRWEHLLQELYLAPFMDHCQVIMSRIRYLQNAEHERMEQSAHLWEV